jgi:hypothetical protein
MVSLPAFVSSPLIFALPDLDWQPHNAASNIISKDSLFILFFCECKPFTGNKKELPAFNVAGNSYLC